MYTRHPVSLVDVQKTRVRTAISALGISWPQRCSINPPWQPAVARRPGSAPGAMLSRPTGDRPLSSGHIRPREHAAEGPAAPAPATSTATPPVAWRLLPGTPLTAADRSVVQE